MLKGRVKQYLPGFNPPSSNVCAENESGSASASASASISESCSSSEAKIAQDSQDQDSREDQWVRYHKLTNERLKAATSAYSVHLAKKKPLPFNLDPSELQELASSLDRDSSITPESQDEPQSQSQPQFQFPKLNLKSLLSPKDDKYTPLQSLAISMLTSANLINSIPSTDDHSQANNVTAYSSSLSVLASAQFSLSTLQSQHEEEMKDFLNRLVRSNVDFQSYQNASKKLHSDQLRLRNCTKRKQSAKKEKEKREAEDEERDARAAYDHSVTSLQTILDSLTSTSTSAYELSSLTDFLHSQLHCVSQSYQIMTRAKESLSLILQGAEAGGQLPNGTSFKSKQDLHEDQLQRSRRNSKSSAKSGGGETLRRADFERENQNEDLKENLHFDGESDPHEDGKEMNTSTSSNFKRPPFLNRKSSSKSEKSNSGSGNFSPSIPSKSILPSSFRRPKTSEGTKSPVLKGGTLISKTLSSNSNSNSNSYSDSNGSFTQELNEEDSSSLKNGGETLTKKNRGRFASFGNSVGSVISTSKPSLGHRAISSVDVKSSSNSSKNDHSSNSNSNSSQNSSSSSTNNEKIASTSGSNWTGFMRKKNAESAGFQNMDLDSGFSSSNHFSGANGNGNGNGSERPKGRARSISMLSSKSNPNQGKNSSTPRLLRKELDQEETDEEIKLERRRLDFDRNFHQADQQEGNSSYDHDDDDDDDDDDVRSFSNAANSRKSTKNLNPLSPIPVSPVSPGYGTEREETGGWTSFRQPEINYTGGSMDLDSNPSPSIESSHSNFPSVSETDRDSLRLSHGMDSGLDPSHTGISLGAFSDGLGQNISLSDDPFNRLNSPSPRISLDSHHHGHGHGHGHPSESLKIGHTPMGSFGEESADQDESYDETQALTLASKEEQDQETHIEGFKGSGNLSENNSNRDNNGGKKGPPPPIPSSSGFLSRKSNPPPPPPPLPHRGSSGFGSLFKK